MAYSKKFEKKDTYEVITNKIIGMLEEGKIPWQKSWQGSGMMPMNFSTKKAYRGINVMMLAFSEFTSNQWLTFNQCKKLGGTILKGSKGQPVVFWKLMDFKDKKTDEKKTVPLIKYSTVFNIEQTKGLKIPEPKAVKPFNTIKQAEKIIKGYKGRPDIKHLKGDDRAYYVPK